MRRSSDVRRTALPGRDILKRRRFLTVMTIITLCLIWGHSAVGREGSAAESGWLFEHLGGLLRLFFGPERATEHLLRKLAHFTEFMLLGAETLLLSREYGKRGARAALTMLMCCNLCAFFDETIQIFSGRGPDVRDIWIDTFGAAAGILLALALAAVRDRLSENRKGKA